MSDKVVIKAENVSKMYRLGAIGMTSMVEDVHRTWAKWRGKEDPYQKVAIQNDRSQKQLSDYVWSLKNIDFEIHQGDAVGIIGKNGAGKSTLLKLLSRVTTPTSGSIKMKGRIASLLEVGTGFHPELTGRENVFMNGTIMGLSRKEIASKLDEIVDFAGVEQYLDTPVKRYSSGMYVRLGFSVAAHLEPDILIVDEVLAVGDAEFQKKCLGKMKDVNSSEGRTLLFVSHNLPSIQVLCQKGLLLDKGMLLASASTKEVLLEYSKLSSKKLSVDVLGNRSLSTTNYHVLMKRIEMYDIDQNLITRISTGLFLKFRIYFHSNVHLVNDVLFRIQILDTDNNIQFICNNDHSYRLVTIVEGDSYIECIVPKFPLFEGEYKVNLLCYSKSVGILDEVEDVLKFEVIDGDFFGTGKIPTIKKGLLVEHYWKYE